MNFGLILLCRLICVLVLFVVTAGDVSGWFLRLALLGKLKHLDIFRGLILAFFFDKKE